MFSFSYPIYNFHFTFFFQIMQKASETLIPVTLELGGKDAFIVCEDVDLATV